MTEVTVDLEGKKATVVGSAPAESLVAAVLTTGKQAQLMSETVLRVDGMMCGHWYALAASHNSPIERRAWLPAPPAPPPR